MANNRLTWQNVAAPDFSGVADNYRVMSELLGRATASGQALVNTYTGAHADAADRAIQQRMLGITDPSQYDAQAILGNNAARASMGMLKAVEGHRATLVDRQVVENNMNWDVATRGRTRDSWGRTDAASPAVQEYNLALLNGNTSRANQILAENPAIRALNGTEFASVAQTGDAFTEREGLYHDTKRSRAKETFDDSAAVDAEALNSMGLGMTGIPYIDDQIISEAARKMGWDAKRTQRARAQMGGGNASSAISSAVSTPGATGGSFTGLGGLPSTRVMNYEARASGIEAVPDSVKTLGDARDFAYQVNSANKARTGKNGSSAMGTYQIVGQTMESYGKQLFGDNWRNQPYNFETEDRVARAIFEDNRGSADALKKQWVSLTPAEAEQVRKMPWDQARQIIARKESSTDLSRGAPDPVGEFGNRVDTADRSLRRNIGTVTQEYLAKIGERGTPLEYATALAQKIPGADAAILVQRINQLQDLAMTEEGGGKPLSGAEAAAVIELSTRDKNAGLDLWGAVDWFKNQSTGGALSINKRQALALIQDITSGAVQQRAKEDLAEGVQQQAVNAAIQQRDALLSEYQKFKAAVELRPELAKYAPYLENRIAAATEAVGALERDIGTARSVATPESPEAAPKTGTTNGGATVSGNVQVQAAQLKTQLDKAQAALNRFDKDYSFTGSAPLNIPTAPGEFEMRLPPAQAKAREELEKRVLEKQREYRKLLAALKKSERVVASQKANAEAGKLIERYSNQ